ncbi:1-acyl-sn-glycerol-3-phosphate acyltransferase [uncultured Neptuniibacter sp.]|uniref:1-acyl-sn-glycerol-3-phosphate acyltransferase n=1 Tax=uncultured Neptuniibacter sp. TaxID=502143 RepID=UPI002613BD5E|nr:1-acyl-sn-glycerol-3-phosphate acyltransferase [uncultured Neptuniibacter sp.]
MSEQQDPYKEIRPYNDSEVADTLTNILHNDEFLTAVTRYQFPKMAARFGWLLKPFVRIALAAKVGEVDSIYDFQMLVANYMKKMIARTTTKLSCSGIDLLDPEEAYLFISNHRDIAMDPAFVNWVRHQYGMDTVRIAIGDNLLQKPYVSDIMRLNKSFIVNRSATGREMMKALTQLSSYIDHSIQSGQSIWLAQREGRAKDGNDATDPALLKMLYMAHRKARSFAEQGKRLNIVPVSISYEYDPCDYLKANELYAKATEGGYEKAQFEDISSIVKGITGDKGHVHIAFGDPIEDDFDSPEALAEEIDRQIISNYYLHPSNLLAAGQDGEISSEQREGFESRLASVSEGARDILRQMYANPVANQKNLQE